MDSILQDPVTANLPVVELESALCEFLEPVTRHLPEKRLQKVGRLAVRGVIGGQSPLVTQMARGVVRQGESIWPMAKRLYRFIWNPRFSHRDLLKGLYGIAQLTVAHHTPSHLVIALDPVNASAELSRRLRKAVYGGVGGDLHRAEEHATWAAWGEALDFRLSRHDSYGGQSACAGGDLCQLVLLHDR